MLSFSGALRKLYSTKAVSGSPATARFRQTRDTVRDDAKHYADKVLPLITSTVSNILALVTTYQVLTYEEWRDKLVDTLTEEWSAEISTFLFYFFSVYMV